MAIAIVVNDRDRTVRVFRSGQPPQVLRGEDPIDLDDVLLGFELTPDELFATLKVR